MLEIRFRSWGNQFSSWSCGFGVFYLLGCCFIDVFGWLFWMNCRYSRAGIYSSLPKVRISYITLVRKELVHHFLPLEWFDIDILRVSLYLQLHPVLPFSLNSETIIFVKNIDLSLLFYALHDCGSVTLMFMCFTCTDCGMFVIKVDAFILMHNCGSFTFIQ